jgi:hypothetical protein
MLLYRAIDVYDLVDHEVLGYFVNLTLHQTTRRAINFKANRVNDRIILAVQLVAL